MILIIQIAMDYKNDLLFGEKRKVDLKHAYDLIFKSLYFETFIIKNQEKSYAGRKG